MISARGDLDSVVRCIELGRRGLPHQALQPGAAAGARGRLARPEAPPRPGAASTCDQLQRGAGSSPRRSCSTSCPRASPTAWSSGESAIADHFAERDRALRRSRWASRPTRRASRRRTVVERLNEIFSAFDRARRAARGGEDQDHRRRLHGGGRPARAAPRSRRRHRRAGHRHAGRRWPRFNRRTGERLVIRIGHPQRAGGRRDHRHQAKFSYDLWGDTVNTASRMESGGPRGRSRSPRPRGACSSPYLTEPRGTIDVKGKGPMETSLLRRRR